MATVDDFIKEWQSDCPWIEARTSGSTGTPKTIRLAKSDMRSSARATNAFFGIGKQSLLGLPLSVDYIAGKMMVVRALEAGCGLHVFPVSSDVLLDACPRRLDLLSLVPAQVPGVLAQLPSCREMPRLLIGGAALPSEMAAAVAASGVEAYVGYGMTETCSHVALSRICAGEDSKRVYKAMPGITFSTDGRSCLRVVAPHFSFGSLQTNDVVDLLSPTEFRWRGRCDNVINSGGLKFFAEELEALYAPALGGRPFCVCSEADARWGERVVLLVECAGAEELERLRTAVEELVADHRRRPKTYIAVRALARTAISGKLKREIPADGVISRIC